MRVLYWMGANSRSKRPNKPPRIFCGGSRPPRTSISNTEAVAMQVKKMIAPAWKFGKELLLFCSVGGLCGAAIGFFMYLQLGPFRNPEDAGYAAGLFVKSGAQLGFIVWMIRLVLLRLRGWFFGSSKGIF
jgi:hypothetical protein